MPTLKYDKILLWTENKKLKTIIIHLISIQLYKMYVMTTHRIKLTIFCLCFLRYTLFVR